MNPKNPAFVFILLLAVSNLFGDMTYEGGATLNGAFLTKLGASAAVISITAGFGEFLGYSLRSVSGLVADKTGKIWAVTLIGYILNLFSVPAMALATNWKIAAVLICTERIGRAIRKPTVEAMLSYTTAKYGKGWVYALNTALDETGATIGPLVVAFALFKGASYRLAYSLLLISSILTLVFVISARIKFLVPAQLQGAEKKTTLSSHKFSKSYWLYMIAGALFASGLLSYELVSVHLVKKSIFAESWIPLLLAFATGSGVLSNLFLGRYYDKLGIKTVILAVLLSTFFAPLAFFGKAWMVIGAMMFLGVGYATQDTLLKAIIAGEIPEGRRSLAFGLFYTGYGVGWFLGSIISGLLYDHSHLALVIFVIVAQFLSIPLFLRASKLSITQTNQV